MEYILMRHVNDSGLSKTYHQIKDIATRNETTLEHEEILERIVSLKIDPKDSYVHDEVIEIVRQREEEFRKYDEEARKHGHPGIIRMNRNVLAETADRINQIVADQPFTIAYNNMLRTEVTAKAVAKITGGSLVAGELHDAHEVYQWMQNYSTKEGLSLIVTHQPAIQTLLLGAEAKHSSAFLVGEITGERLTYKEI